MLTQKQIDFLKSEHDSSSRFNKESFSERLGNAMREYLQVAYNSDSKSCHLSKKHIFVGDAIQTIDEDGEQWCKLLCLQGKINGLLRNLFDEQKIERFWKNQLNMTPFITSGEIYSERNLGFLYNPMREKGQFAIMNGDLFHNLYDSYEDARDAYFYEKYGCSYEDFCKSNYGTTSC